MTEFVVIRAQEVALKTQFVHRCTMELIVHVKMDIQEIRLRIAMKFLSQIIFSDFLSQQNFALKIGMKIVD